MPSKQLVEKRNELNAKRKALKDTWAEANTGNGDEKDYERIKSLGEGLTPAAKAEKLAAMGKEVKALADEVEELASSEQLVSEEIQAEMKAGGKRGMRHQDVEDMDEKKQREIKSVGELIINSDEYKAAKEQDFAFMRQKDGRLRFNMKDLFGYRKAITTVGIGSSTSGVQQQQRLDGITGIARRGLRIRDIMRTRTMTQGNSYDWVRQSGRTNLASVQHEGTRKAESTYTWTTESDTIKTIAHFTKVSRQALDDIAWLRGEIDDELLYGLLLKEEEEILEGDGTGQHLNGLVTQATAYDTALNVSNDTKLDKVRHAKLQARLAGLATFAPDGIVLNPQDLHDIELIKSDEGTTSNRGLYVVGDPTTGQQIMRLWGLTVVESDAMDVGKFLVGAFGTAAELIDRMQAMIAIAYENEDDFVNNLATILAEERLGLAVRRPEAFIYGGF